LTQGDFDDVLRSANLKKLRSTSVQYPQVRKLTRALLEKAFARFEARQRHDHDTAQRFMEFCANENAWLHDYVFFRALMERNGGSEAWDHWPEEQQSIPAAREWLEGQLTETKERFAQREQFFRYVQWIAYEQWIGAKAYADERGVALMGDIPFGVSYYSADVFARPDQFLLEWSGGAPPEPYFKDDEFTQKWGQNWGIPLYNWGAMRATNFDWWRQRVHRVRRIFHVFRVDHVLGFYRIYAFPWRPQRNPEFLPLRWDEMLQRTSGRIPHYAPRDDSTGENCDANRREGEDYLRMVLEAAASTWLVGEDLGTVPSFVRPSLQSLGIAGFKIPQWESTSNGRITAGSEYEGLSVTTYATHDHKPVRAMWDEAFDHQSRTRNQAREELNKIAQFAGIDSLPDDPDFDRHFYGPAMKALFQSEAWIAIVMITDLLARKERFNVPGTATGSNWSRRLHLTVARLGSSRAIRQRMKAMKSILLETGRA
ncbi:MAG TPA: 4-alpha-glucanotransferase, partial [Chthoniobacterales bacterium]|nr:4-alpha-glucanotransferase [Chthoniobacterales bacterium]